MDNTIYIASDHAGFQLKSALIAWLKEEHYEVIDCGPEHYDQHDDYPGFAQALCENVLKHHGRGILICDTGIGMCIAANRFKGIRAAMVTTLFMAERSRLHNNANVICLGQDVVSQEENIELVKIWLSTDFSAAERHIRRLEAIDSLRV